MNLRHYFPPACPAMALIIGSLFGLTGCSDCAALTDVRAPVPIPEPQPYNASRPVTIPEPQPYNASRPVTWVAISLQDGLAPGDIVAVRPNCIYDVSAQFQI